MEKEIIVRVLGRQYDGEDADEMEVVTTGIYHQKNGNQNALEVPSSNELCGHLPEQL